MSNPIFWLINIIALVLWAPTAYVLFKSWYRSPKNVTKGLEETSGRETSTLFRKGVKEAVGNQLFEIGLAAFIIYQLVMLMVCRTLVWLVAGWFGYEGS